MLTVAFANPNGSFIPACCWLTQLAPGKAVDGPKLGVGAALPALLFCCIPSKAANGSAEAATETGFSVVVANGSKTGFAELALDVSVKSVKASSPPPNASKTLLLAVDAADGAENASNTEGDDTFGALNASKGEAFG